MYSIFRSSDQENIKDLLYYRLDNHGNQLGAFYTAPEVFKRIHIDFPQIPAIELRNFTRSHLKNAAGAKKSGFKSKARQFFEP